MKRRPPQALTEGQVNEFKLNGFLAVEDVLSAEEVKAVAERSDFIASGKADHIPETGVQLEPEFREGRRPVTNRVMQVRKLYNTAAVDDVMWGHACNPEIVDMVSDLLGTEDIKMYGDQLFMKPPEVGSVQQWHMDSGSWRNIFPMDLVTAWTAIDDATPENGCLEFIPGSHRWGMMTRDQLEPFMDDFGHDPWTITSVPLRSGSVSFHHSLALHRSAANRSGKRRRGYAVHYMRAKSRDDQSVNGPKMPPFKQVRGRSFPGCV